MGRSHLTFDAAQRHLFVEKRVTRDSATGQDRLYYRFRPARWYGGIFTADCSGCGLLCRFCWLSDDALFKPDRVGKFYSSEEAARRVASGARRRGYDQVRISGGEPTIGFPHLVGVLERLKGENLRFILETNGILLGFDEKYARELSAYDFVHARISFKGTSRQEFSLLTGADPGGFDLQLGSLKNLKRYGVSFHPAVMTSFSTRQSFATFLAQLRSIDDQLADNVEVEELILYPHVVRRLDRHQLRPATGHQPDRVPPRLI